MSGLRLIMKAMQNRDEKHLQVGANREADAAADAGDGADLVRRSSRLVIVTYISRIGR